MFIAALFTIARIWKQSRCPSMDERIKKLWYIYTMHYYSAIKKNAFESVLMRWMNLEPITERSKSLFYITICKIDSQGEFAVWLRKLKQGFCINLEGWDREGDGREVQKGGDIWVPMAIMLRFDRKQQNSVKQLSFNKK